MSSTRAHHSLRVPCRRRELWLDVDLATQKVLAHDGHLNQQEQEDYDPEWDGPASIPPNTPAQLESGSNDRSGEDALVYAERLIEGNVFGCSGFNAQ